MSLNYSKGDLTSTTSQMMKISPTEIESSKSSTSNSNMSRGLLMPNRLRRSFVTFVCSSSRDHPLKWVSEITKGYFMWINLGLSFSDPWMPKKYPFIICLSFNADQYPMISSMPILWYPLIHHGPMEFPVGNFQSCSRCVLCATRWRKWRRSGDQILK